jgi:hypothetical protein
MDSISFAWGQWGTSVTRWNRLANKLLLKPYGLELQFVGLVYDNYLLTGLLCDIPALRNRSILSVFVATFVVDGHGQWYEDRNAEQLFDELESAVGRFE